MSGPRRAMAVLSLGSAVLVVVVSATVLVRNGNHLGGALLGVAIAVGGAWCAAFPHAIRHGRLEASRSGVAS